MSKVILVLSDALRDDVAARQMGFLEHLVEEARATRFTISAGLPTLSRPLYETIHTGMSAVEHGVVSNDVVRRSNVPNIFQWAREQGKTTAAAAYSWYCELYVRHPYNPIDDRELDDESAWIQHGRYYTDYLYPDRELLATGAMLVRRYQPDYLLMHPMGMDTMGHLYGADSPQYRNQAITQDQILSDYVPEWLGMGYAVLVTGDHGMSDDRQHNGTTPDVRLVPLYIIPPEGNGKGNTGGVLSQLRLAPTICGLLGIPPAPTMRHPAIPY